MMLIKILNLILSFTNFLFFRFDARIIGAPAIVYCHGENITNKDDQILVAGHSLEINATSDIDLHMSFPQILLLQNIAQDNIRYFMYYILRNISNQVISKKLIFLSYRH